MRTHKLLKRTAALICRLVVVFAAAAAMAQDVSFMARRELPAGLFPTSVAVADLNGDGIPDLVAVSTGQGVVASAIVVLLGNGEGGFYRQVQPSPEVGTLPQSVVVADFNGDGVPDLAVANSGSNDVSVLLGTGDGTFQAAQTFGAGGDLPNSAAVGDFNGDGVPDLAVANSGSNNVAVLLGNGDGSFQTPVPFDAGAVPRAVAVAKFRGPEMPDDLVVANGGSNNVSVLLGNGDGSFQNGGTFTVGGSPYSVALGDFNGDELVDLAVASSGSPSNVSVLLGNGDGTFQPAVNFRVGSSPRSVAVAKFRGMKMPDDLAVANRDSNTVSVLLGRGDGSFEPARIIAAGAKPISVAVGEFHGDGLLDLVLVNQGEGVPPRFGGALSVLLGNGDGSFQLPQSFYTHSGSPSSLAVGDFNDDGLPDVALSNPNSTVSVVLGNGDGTFQPEVDFPAGVNPSLIAVGKLRGPTMPDDLVMRTAGSNVTALLSNGDGTFQPPQDSYAGSFGSLALGDFNNDGLLDAAVCCSAGGVSVLLGNGDGSFQAPQTFGVGQNPVSLAVGDFNGDGALDLAVADDGFSGSFVRVLLGNGDGSFQPPRSLGLLGRLSTLAVGDFNGDEQLDIAVTAQPRGQPSPIVYILLGNGDGTFDVGYVLGVPCYLCGPGAVVGKFRDPAMQDDLVVTIPNQNKILVALFRGDGSLEAAPIFDGSAAGAGDFNSDGRLDLIFPTAYGFSVIFNRTPR